MDDIVNSQTTEKFIIGNIATTIVKPVVDFAQDGHCRVEYIIGNRCCAARKLV